VMRRVMTSRHTGGSAKLVINEGEDTPRMTRELTGVRSVLCIKRAAVRCALERLARDAMRGG
jgi:hypothetical protein